MNDTKNILIAWVSSASSLLAAVEYREVVTILSAVVLPVVFFAIGKTVDVLVQVYLDRRRDMNSARANGGEACLAAGSPQDIPEPAKQATNRSKICRPQNAGSGEFFSEEDGKAEPHRHSERQSRKTKR